MAARAIVLFSGGLDSMLAVRVLQEQGVEVEALNFRTLFTCCQDQASAAAARLDVRLTVAVQEDDYLDVIRRPRHGYGRGANPCVDCRIYMFERAARWMEEIGADFVASGEVLGQRPMSQKKRDLLVIAHRAGLDDRLLRPLSAKLLPRTRPEEQGLVDRARLHGFTGRSRKGLIELARGFGFDDIPQPSSGCALTTAPMAAKVFDLLEFDADNSRWDFELLRLGRHLRRDPRVKLIVGRREEENAQLVWMSRRDDARPCALIEPDNFLGPAGLLVGEIDAAAVEWGAAQLLAYGRIEPGVEPAVNVTEQGVSARRAVSSPPPERCVTIGG